MRKTATVFVLTTLLCILGTACDKIPGAGDTPPQQPIPAAPTQPMIPGQQAAVPGQPAVPTVPGQAAIPGQPAVPTVPGQAAIPGQPAVPAQPAIPGQVPAAAPAAPATPPAPTGDPLTDKLNAKKFEVAPEMQPTSSLLKQVLKKNTPQSYQVQLAGPPYCQTFIAAAPDTVKDINLKLETPAGAIAAQDATAESIAVIANQCPAIPGVYKLTVEIPGGEGEFAVQVFSK
jgi:hypothetical protein